MSMLNQVLIQSDQISNNKDSPLRVHKENQITTTLTKRNHLGTLQVQVAPMAQMTQVPLKLTMEGRQFLLEEGRN
jgi:hypothetical protein